MIPPAHYNETDKLQCSDYLIDGSVYWKLRHYAAIPVSATKASITISSFTTPAPNVSM